MTQQETEKILGTHTQWVTQHEIDKILESHRQWVAAGSPAGDARRANLRGADLRGALLVGADLRETRLTDDQLSLPGVAEALLEAWAKGDAELLHQTLDNTAEAGIMRAQGAECTKRS